MTIKKLKSIDIINVLSDLVSKKLETTVKLPADEDMREMVDAIQEAYLIAKKNNKKYTPKKYRKDE